MNDNEFAKAIDICEKLDFFGGQRAGRELWFEKPVDVQDIDIKQFVEDVAFLKDFINRQKAEIERLNHIRAELSKEIDIWKDIAKRETGYVGIARSEAIKEFAERLKAEATLQHGGVTVVYGSCIDNLVKEMTEETP